jgi:hypothetical protein
VGTIWVLDGYWPRSILDAYYILDRREEPMPDLDHLSTERLQAYAAKLRSDIVQHGPDDLAGLTASILNSVERILADRGSCWLAS